MADVQYDVQTRKGKNRTIYTIVRTGPRGGKKFITADADQVTAQRVYMALAAHSAYEL